MESADINDPDELTTNFTGLASDTSYLVGVAGVNARGTDIYRDLTVNTPQSQSTQQHCALVLVIKFLSFATQLSTSTLGE